MPIRVTYVITDLEVGGVPLHLYRLATRLDRGRVLARVISLADEGPVGIRLRRAGIPVQACEARSAWDIRALGRLWRMLRNDPPDVLHSLLFHANVAVRLVGPAAGTPIERILCEIQTAERERAWHLVVDNLTCRLCRLEIGNSPSVVAHLHRYAHLPLSRLHCEWGAVDVDAIRAAVPADRAKLGIENGEQMILWTGRLDPVKGFEEMLGGFGRVSMPAARLVLAGEGPYRPAIERLIRDLGLEGRVVMLGERSDVPSLLQAADVFLFGSRTEGVPNAVLEAMAAGLPIIATDVPGCRDLIRDGQTGWLVPAGSAVAIAAALERALRDPVSGRRMGTRAQEWVTRSASISQLGPRWEQFYGRAMKRTAPFRS